MVSLLYLYVLMVLLLAVTAVAGYRRRARDGGEMLRDVAAVAAFVPLTAAFFWQLIFIDQTSVPRGGGDLASFLYPVYSFAAGNIQQGILPLWNPYLYSGSPFAADMQTGLFYPVNLLAFFTARPFTYVTMEELAVVHFFLAACFTYLYVRSLDVRRVPSFAAGTVFAFGGFVTAHLGHLNMIAAAVWLPLILLFFHRAVAKGSVISAAFAGAVFAVSVLAGHIQITLYIAFTLTLYWLWHLLFPRWKRDSSATGHSASAFWPRVLSLPITGLVALGASAVQVLPSFELTRLSVRAELTYSGAAEYAASPTGLITLLIPHFFGDNPVTFWGVKWNLVEVYGYVAILPLLLAPLAIILRRNRSGIVLFFAGLAAAALLLSLGEYTVLHGWLHRFVPGFDKVRSAGRFLLLFDFALAVLAALGLDHLGSPLRKRERPRYKVLRSLGVTALAGLVFVACPFFYYSLLTSQDKDPVIFQRVEQVIASLNLSVLFLAASVVLLVVGRRHFKRGVILQGVAVLLITLDLFSANAGFNTTTEDVLTGFDHPQIIQFLKERTREEPGRVDSVTGISGKWQPDVTLLNQVGDVMGIFNPMMLADYSLYWESLGSRSSPAYDILNAKYVIAREDVELDWAKFRPVPMDSFSGLRVYENVRALPRAVLVPRAEVVDRDKMLERLRATDFDPKTVALVEEPIEGLSSENGEGFEGRVLQTHYPSPNEILVETESNHPGLLLVSDVSYPGWEARVDGKEAKVFRANYTFKSVFVPAGGHEVRLMFKPRIWETGAAISGLFWLFLVALAIGRPAYEALRRPSSGPPGGPLIRS